MTELLGSNFWDLTGFSDLMIRFIFNLIIITVLVRGIYFGYKKDKEYAFTFFLFNILIFFVCYIFSNADLSMGFAFGLFAIFGFIRYRTNTIPIKEMTYLFTSITIALMNALRIEDMSLLAVLLVNAIILATVFIMEKLWFAQRTQYQNIIYEKIELIQEGNNALVLEDLRKRTNLNITDFQIRSVNFLNDSVEMRVYFIPKK